MKIQSPSQQPKKYSNKKASFIAGFPNLILIDDYLELTVDDPVTGAFGENCPTP